MENMFTLVFGLCVYVDYEGYDIFSVDLLGETSSLKCIILIFLQYSLIIISNLFID